MASDPIAERRRRWRLVLGGEDDADLGAEDARIDKALSLLYDRSSSGRRGGLGDSVPRVARWLDDIREYFPTPVVQVIQRDAFDRLGLKSMLMQPEFLATVEADIHLVADLIALRAAMPEKAKSTARQVVRKVVDELMECLAREMSSAVRGAIDRARRTSRPHFRDIDWPRTIRANLKTFQPADGVIVPERLVGHRRRAHARTDLDTVILCVDQSGSMATSVVYASIFAAVMASLPVIATKLVCFDTTILDLTDDLADPVEVLFGVQLGGGTDINQALAYCTGLVTQPAKTHMVLISDLFEGGDEVAMIERAGQLVASGVNLIVLLALSDAGKPSSDMENARKLAALGCPVFACTPGQFPALMAVALQRGDVLAWAAATGIAAVRGA